MSDVSYGYGFFDFSQKSEKIHNLSLYRNATQNIAHRGLEKNIPVALAQRPRAANPAILLVNNHIAGIAAAINYRETFACALDHDAGLQVYLLQVVSWCDHHDIAGDRGIDTTKRLMREQAHDRKSLRQAGV